MDDSDGARTRILLVDDDTALVDALTALLRREGYHVESARDGQRGLHLGLTRRYDVLILAREIPALDGLDVLTRLRGQGRTARVLVTSTRDAPPDRVAGLDAGADDYLGKPFDRAELLARLRALLRRHLDDARCLPVGTGRLELDDRTVVRRSGAPVGLSERECALLAVLATRPTRVFTRTDLMRRAFPEAGGETVVDTYVHYLRRKLGPDVVVTVRGRGYRLGARGAHRGTRF